MSRQSGTMRITALEAFGIDEQVIDL